MSRMTEAKELAEKHAAYCVESGANCFLAGWNARNDEVTQLLAEIEALRSELETKNKLFKEVSRSELRHDIVKDEAVLERNQLREQLAVAEREIQRLKKCLK